MASCIILGQCSLTPRDTCRSLNWSKYLLRANFSLASSCKLGNALLASNNRSSSKSAQDSLSRFVCSRTLLYIAVTCWAAQIAGSELPWWLCKIGGSLKTINYIHLMCLSHQSNSQPKNLIIVTPSINSRYTLKVTYLINKTFISIKNLWECTPVAVTRSFDLLLTGCSWSFRYGDC